MKYKWHNETYNLSSKIKLERELNGSSNMHGLLVQFCQVYIKVYGSSAICTSLKDGYYYIEFLTHMRADFPTVRLYCPIDRGTARSTNILTSLYHLLMPEERLRFLLNYFFIFIFSPGILLVMQCKCVLIFFRVWAGLVVKWN
jgi:hypothetical protein